MNPKDEKICVEESSNEALVAQILENKDDPDHIESTVENNDVAHPCPHLTSTSIHRGYVEEGAMCSNHGYFALLKRAVREKHRILT